MLKNSPAHGLFFEVRIITIMTNIERIYLFNKHLRFLIFGSN